MAFSLGEILVKLGLDNSGLQQGLDQSKEKVGGFSNEVEKLGRTIAAAFAVKEITEFGVQAFQLAESMKPVRAAFDNTGASLVALRQATNNTVSDFVLLQSAVRASNFNIPVERLASAFEFATVRAAETGQEVDYLVNSIIDGIGRKSSLVLDNLGISASELQEEFAKTGDFAQAAFNIIDRQAGTATTKIEDVGTSTQKLAVAWERFQTGVGAFLASGGVLSGLLDELSFKVGQFGDVLNLAFSEDRATEVQKLQSELGTLENRLKELSQGTFKIQDIFGGRDAAIGETVGQIEEVKNKLNELRTEQGRAAFEADDYKRSTKEITAVAGKAAPAIKDLADAYGLQAAAFQSLQGLEFDRVKENLAFNPQDAIDFGLIDGDRGYFDDIENEFVEVAEAIEEKTLDLGNFVAGAFSELGTQLGSVLSGEFDGSKFLGALASFGEAFGKQLIAIGVASLALKNAIKSPFAAIAGGIGLIAISKLIANTASNAQSSVSNIAGGGFGGGGSVPFAVSGSSGDVIGQSTIGGQKDIILKLNNREVGRAVAIGDAYTSRTG